MRGPPSSRANCAAVQSSCWDRVHIRLLPLPSPASFSSLPQVLSPGAFPKKPPARKSLIQSANLLFSLRPRETNLPQPTGRTWEAQAFGSPPPPVHSICSVFSQHVAPRFLGCSLRRHFSTLGLNLYSFF